MIQIREAVDAALRERAARSGLATAWGLPLKDDEWAVLLSHAVEPFKQGQRTIEDLVALIFDIRRAYLGRARVRRRAGRRGIRPGRQVTALEAAISDACTAHLEQDADDRFQVRRFRKDVLRDRVVNNVGGWLKAQLKNQGAPTINRGRVQLLRIRVDGESIARATRQDHPLDWLRQISEALAAFYGWERTDATMFVLTRERPLVPSLTADVKLTWPMFARSRITLTVAPTATPAEVAVLYSRERTRAFGRVRRLSPKHASLAAFVFSRPESTDRELMNQLE